MKMLDVFLLSFLLSVSYCTQAGKRACEEGDVPSEKRKSECLKYSWIAVTDELIESLEQEVDRNRIRSQFFTQIRKGIAVLRGSDSSQEKKAALVGLYDMHKALVELGESYEGFDHFLGQIHQYIEKDYPHLRESFCSDDASVQRVFEDLVSHEFDK